MSKILTACFVLLLANNSFAQASATADATATIVQPISITKTQDLQFGSIAAAATSGTVKVDTAGSRTKTGAITLVNIGAVTAALFTVSGDAGRGYNITLPTGDVTLNSGGNSMAVNTFTSSPTATGTLSGTIGTPGVSGTQQIKVGATLNVGATQGAGVYTGTFSVGVNYN